MKSWFVISAEAWVGEVFTTCTVQLLGKVPAPLRYVQPKRKDLSVKALVEPIVLPIWWPGEAAFVPLDGSIPGKPVVVEERAVKLVTVKVVQ